MALEAAVIRLAARAAVRLTPVEASHLIEAQPESDSAG